MKPLITIAILSAVAFLCGNTITWLPLPTAAVLIIVAAILITLAIILIRWATREADAITTPGPRQYYFGYDVARPDSDYCSGVLMHTRVMPDGTVVYSQASGHPPIVIGHVVENSRPSDHLTGIWLQGKNPCGKSETIARIFPADRSTADR